VISYHSTRGAAPLQSFADVLLAGLAPDGGLYLPSTWPLGHTPSTNRPYADFAAEVMWPFVEGSIERDEFEAICSASYATFTHDEVIPIVELPDGIGLVELFHGPTLAFKDVAMQLLGRLFDHELARRGTRVTIVGATSGDTGSAAIEAFRDRSNVDIVILHPHERTSDVQRRQMTTVQADNVHNVAVRGTFDDCQDIVKAMFADVGFRDEVQLAAVNSINWARVMAQVVYYHWAAGRYRGAPEPVSVTVPTGNFGNVFAGRVAMRMGAAIHDFVVASNRNDILTRFFTTGSMTIDGVEPSLSPSMDIQVSSNLERLIYEMFDGDGAKVGSALATFRRTGHIEFGDDVRTKLAERWCAESVSDAETIDVMRSTFETSGIVIDPHTAVGVGAARRRSGAFPQLVLATAHPAKFPDAVEQATGVRPSLPAHLADLHERPEFYDVVDNDVAALQEFVRNCRSAGSGG
jgi:threonine synthase